MTTSQETPTTELPQPTWREAMAEFRARAQRLFETQRDRVDLLQVAIAEQLAELEQANERPPTIATNDREGIRGASSAELEELRAQLVQCRKQLNRRASELKQLRSLLAEHADGVQGIDVEALLEQLSQAQSERDELLKRLADGGGEVDQGSAADAKHLDDLQHRFELAVQEIRELKAKNAALQQQASRRQVTAHGATAAVAGFDWEQQKLLLMQQLESDVDGSVPEENEAKLSIESTIRVTDDVIAEKDRQIAELRSQLEKRAVSSQEASLSSTLDLDEQIHQERERLGHLQTEWREKLRQAEIELSLERAKLGRERTELEAKLRGLEDSNSDAASSKGSSQPSGRWLRRLGLWDDEK